MSPSKCDKVPCCFGLDLDLDKRCKTQHCSQDVDLGSKHLPKGHKIRISVKKHCGSSFEPLGEFSSIGHFVVNLCHRDKGYYDVLVELVALLPGGEEVVSSDQVQVCICDSPNPHPARPWLACDKDKCVDSSSSSSSDSDSSRDSDKDKKCKKHKKRCKHGSKHSTTGDDWDCYSTFRS